MIHVHDNIYLDEREVGFSMIRAQGAGGQNVNKVSSAVHLRFDIRASSLPQDIKDALLVLNDRRISSDGVVVIKAQSSRSQDKNRAEALERLAAMIQGVSVPAIPRKATRPTRGSQQRRLQRKVLHGRTKELRGKVSER
jgi:ribosome-associated protein